MFLAKKLWSKYLVAHFAVAAGFPRPAIFWASERRAIEDAPLYLPSPLVFGQLRNFNRYCLIYGHK